MSLEAANPAINATVTASAGSGNTWMLVTRILRLLLEGTEPGGIMALTFTRKAAGEMQQRLFERLFSLARLKMINWINSWQNWDLKPMITTGNGRGNSTNFISTVIIRCAPRPFIHFVRIFWRAFHWKPMCLPVLNYSNRPRC